MTASPGPGPDTELVLIRHGVTAWNRERRFQGRIDVALDPEGLAQAALTARRMAAVPVAAVYASDLSRAQQTALPIAQAHGLPLQIESGLRERDFGGFEGLTQDELLHRHPEAFRRWRARDPDFELPGGGETLRVFHARVLRAIETLARRHAGRTIVAVTHGGVLDCVYRIACGLPLDAVHGVALLNASLNSIAWNGAAFSLSRWGDVDHLAADAAGAPRART